MRALLIALLAVALAGCSPGPGTSPSPSATTSIAGIAAAACADTTWSGCVDDVTLAASTWPGKLVAICEYDSDTGDVVRIESVAGAEAMCSADGLLSPSRVVTTLRLPK